MLATSVNAQQYCGTAKYQQTVRDLSAGSMPHRMEAGDISSTANSGITVTGNQDALPTGPSRIIIPVVVHVLYNKDHENISDDQILSQIESLNADFSKANPDFKNVPPVFAALAANTGIVFQLAKSDPSGRATTGIIRKKTNRMMWTDDDKIKSDQQGGSSPWDSRHYLNIWVGSLINSLLGYASFPGGPAELDGIVVRYDIFGTRGKLTAPYNKGRTMTHEVGHWLNLKHLWGDVSCGDDGIADTPRQLGGSRGRPAFPLITAACDNGPDGAMFMNFMDFTDDASMHMFTTGQAIMMQSMFAANGPRVTILSSKGVEEPWNTSIPEPVGVTASGSMQVYPNPVTSGTLTIAVSGDQVQSGKPYTIFNALGQPLIRGILTNEQNQVRVGQLSPGIYFIRVGEGNEGKIARFMRK
jgi:hypothetical protein